MGDLWGSSGVYNDWTLIGWRSASPVIKGDNYESQTPFFNDDGDNADGLSRAGLDASRSFACRQPLVAHVAFTDDAEALAVFRHVVGALQDTI